MVLHLSRSRRKSIKDKLKFIYGEPTATGVFRDLKQLLEDFAENHPGLVKQQPGDNRLTEKDIVVITYGDQLQHPSEKPLAVLHWFFRKYLQDVVSTIHILPFFPYSSDDGFAVIDYRQVNPELGNWKHIEELGRDFDLMFDAVINHISSKSRWFKEYRQGHPRYQDYFIEVDPESDLSNVVRPRARPLLTEVETARGTKYVWTTFSPDQPDLNYQDPGVLLEIIDLLLFYVDKGARIIRMDAIAYLWKEVGTSCIHLSETHKIIQLFKDVFEVVAPETLILTETNVPHQENLSYFGQEEKEADMVYQFTLPPLVLHSFISGNASRLTEWAAELEESDPGNYYFNFLASHDGIGLRPVEGILQEREIEVLVTTARDKGGYVSYKTNQDGSKSPYELNISYVDAIIDREAPAGRQVDQFLASQAIMLVLQGVPGIYFHSLVGSTNYQKGVEKTGKKRSINREKLQEDELLEELTETGSLRKRIFDKYRQMLAVRRQQPAFNPEAPQKVLEIDDRVFALIRGQALEEKIIALQNVSGDYVELEIDLSSLGVPAHFSLQDLLGDGHYITDKNGLKLSLKPYQVSWLRWK